MQEEVKAHFEKINERLAALNLPTQLRVCDGSTLELEYETDIIGEDLAEMLGFMEQPFNAWPKGINYKFSHLDVSSIPAEQQLSLKLSGDYWWKDQEDVQALIGQLELKYPDQILYTVKKHATPALWEERTGHRAVEALEKYLEEEMPVLQDSLGTEYFILEQENNDYLLQSKKTKEYVIVDNWKGGGQVEKKGMNYGDNASLARTIFDRAYLTNPRETPQEEKAWEHSSFEIEEKIGVIERRLTGWARDLTLTSWNGRPPVIDIHDWNWEHTRMINGLTLHSDEAKKLNELLQEGIKQNFAYEPTNIKHVGGGKLDIAYEMKAHLGVITEYPTGWTRELNFVSWHGREPELDIRDWTEDHKRISKGITLTPYVAEKLQGLLQKHELTRIDMEKSTADISFKPSPKKNPFKVKEVAIDHEIGE